MLRLASGRARAGSAGLVAVTLDKRTLHRAPVTLE